MGRIFVYVRMYHELCRSWIIVDVPGIMGTGVWTWRALPGVEAQRKIDLVASWLTDESRLSCNFLFFFFFQSPEVFAFK